MLHIDLRLFDLSQIHPEVFRQLVDLIGITSIMEVGSIWVQWWFLYKNVSFL